MDIETSRIPNIQIQNIGSKKVPHYAIKGFIELAKWTGYFLYDETYKLIKDKVVTKGRINLWVDGLIEPDSSFHVSQEQVNAYLYLVEHEESIQHSILEKLKKQFPRLLSKEYASWDLDDPNFPKVSAFTPESDFKNYIGPESISIGEDVKDEVAYTTWNFRCRWDVEHGFEVITHKNSVIDIAPEADIWKIYKDNGNYARQQEKDTKTEWKLPKKKKWWQFW